MNRRMLALSYLAALLAVGLAVDGLLAHPTLLLAQASPLAHGLLARGSLFPVFLLLALNALVFYLLCPRARASAPDSGPVNALLVIGLGAALGTVALITATLLSGMVDRLVAMSSPIGVPALLLAASVLPALGAALLVVGLQRLVRLQRAAVGVLAV